MEAGSMEPEHSQWSLADLADVWLKVTEADTSNSCSSGLENQRGPALPQGSVAVSTGVYRDRSMYF